jgi:hypothetical protein
MYASNYNRWATPEEVEEALNGDGIQGAVWIHVSGDVDEGDAQFDLSVPIVEFLGWEANGE